MKAVFASALAFLLAAPGVFAQDEEATREDPGEVIRAADLVGRDIQNRQGEELGDIEDIVFDVRSGQVLYMVLSYGETAGLGGKWFAIPPKAISIPQGQDHLLLNVPKATLESNKGFTDENWPAEADYTLVGDDVEKPELPAAKERVTMRHSQIVDVDVVGRDGETLGEIDAVVVGLNNHKIVYAAMGSGGVAGIGESLFAIAWEDLQYNTQAENFQLNATKADFENREGFDTGNWPAKADRRFKRGE